MTQIVTVDFETEAIVGNPVRTPPKPVGVAIKYRDQEPFYTTDYTELRNLWVDPEVEMLFHNAPFDIRVAEVHLDLPRPHWKRVHDTMFLLFFEDPYGNLGLKPCADRYLDLPPEEQDALKAWILQHITGGKEKGWGAHISEAPFDLVAPYAEGDVLRTEMLFDHLHEWHDTRAYAREREVMYMFMDSTIRGLRVNRPLLASHIPVLRQNLVAAEQLLRTRLNVGIGVNLNSSAQLAAALDAAGVVDGWELTPTGRKSTKKDNLRKHITDLDLLQLMDYIGSLSNCLTTFMEPWYELSEETGRIYPEWNQIRNFEKGSQAGTRTGRPSCSKPNLLNVPTEFKVQPPPDYTALPYCRQYLLPEEGHVWCKRDFASQEVRIAAHFEDGDLMRQFQEDPNFDPHKMAMGIILANTGIKLDRKQVKIMAFRIIYGGGAPAVAGALNIPVAEGAELKDAYLDAVPGIRKLAQSCTRRGYNGMPIRTWGGRTYYTEPSKGGYTWEYKLINYLIQGSAADQTKQCMIEWNNVREPDELFMVQVYDEINISVPEWKVDAGMKRLKSSMEQDFFDVPMLSEGEKGPNWYELTECA